MDEKKSQARSALSSGASLLKMGDVVQALGHLQRAVELDPHSPEARYLLGSCYLQLEDTERAEVEVRQSIGLASDNPNAHYLLGLCLERRGEVVKAQLAYRIALTVDPNHRLARKKLGAGGEQPGSHRTTAGMKSAFGGSGEVERRPLDSGMEKGVYTDIKSELVYRLECSMRFLTCLLLCIGIAYGIRTAMNETHRQWIAVQPMLTQQELTYPRQLTNKEREDLANSKRIKAHEEFVWSNAWITLLGTLIGLAYGTVSAGNVRRFK